jgi:hypothetical protein
MTIPESFAIKEKKMKSTLSLSIALAVLCALTVQAQTHAPDAFAGAKEAAETRFSQCMKSEDCSVRVRFQIIQEENDKMNAHFQNIHQACADVDFQNCIGKKKEDIRAWYGAQDAMRQMMRSMEGQDLETREPAAGKALSSAL